MASLHYRKVGQGPHVILIHGFPNDGSSWDGIYQILSKDFTVWMPDLPGAGKSAAQENLTMEKMAASILDMMDEQQIDKAVIAGHSMGGYTAMACLEMFPERIAGISMVHSLASADSAEKKETRQKGIDLILKGADAQKNFLTAMAKNLFHEDFAAEHPEELNQVVEQGMQIEGAALAAFYRAMKERKDHTDTLQDSTIPMQWIIGSDDKATPKEEALNQAFLAEINHVHIYPDTGHMSMREKPSRIKQDLSLFCHFCFSRL